jgi:hypothetical protein
MRHEQITMDGAYDRLDLTDFLNELPQAQGPFRSARAAPDIPVGVGQMLVAAYVTLLATFAVTIAHSREALFAMGICAVFLTMYLSVPRIFFGVEPRQGKRPSYDAFLKTGLETYTGHCDGTDALVQILIVPVLLTLCALAMGIVALWAL